VELTLLGRTATVWAVARKIIALEAGTRLDLELALTVSRWALATHEPFLVQGKGDLNLVA
jgi:hypothetical protein